MNVFISHKQEDELHAREVFSVLTRNGVEAYLDVLDPHMGAQTSGALTAHIIEMLSKCTHIIPVVTDKTERSWWVPFEIGIATEKGRSIASYVPRVMALPEFLHEWPYLSSTKELDDYVLVARSQRDKFSRTNYETKGVSEKRTTSRSFERELKSRLDFARR